jgi:hypothetical protein
MLGLRYHTNLEEENTPFVYDNASRNCSRNSLVLEGTSKYRLAHSRFLGSFFELNVDGIGRKVVRSRSCHRSLVPLLRREQIGDHSVVESNVMLQEVENDRVNHANSQATTHASVRAKTERKKGPRLEFIDIIGGGF